MANWQWHGMAYLKRGVMGQTGNMGGWIPQDVEKSDRTVVIGERR